MSAGVLAMTILWPLLLSLAIITSVVRWRRKRSWPAGLLGAGAALELVRIALLSLVDAHVASDIIAVLVSVVAGVAGVWLIIWPAGRLGCSR